MISSCEFCKKEYENKFNRKQQRFCSQYCRIKAAKRKPGGTWWGKISLA